MADENYAISLKGNAQLTVGVTITGDSIQYGTEPMKLIAVGSASMTGDGVDISADRIEANGEKMTLKGNAKFASVNDEPFKLKGLLIETNEDGIFVDGAKQKDPSE